MGFSKSANTLKISLILPLAADFSLSVFLHFYEPDEPEAGKKGVEKKVAEDGPYCLIKAKLGKQAISTMISNKVLTIFFQCQHPYIHM